MKKTIFEEIGCTYIRHGDYLIPCLTLPEEEEQRFIGVWGQRHLHYLKEYHKGVYLNLLTSGRLNDYLADIKEQAQERFERIVEQMKQAQGITEQLKVDDTLEWIGQIKTFGFSPPILTHFQPFTVPLCLVPVKIEKLQKT